MKNIELLRAFNNDKDVLAKIRKSVYEYVMTMLNLKFMKQLKLQDIVKAE